MSRAAIMPTSLPGWAIAAAIMLLAVAPAAGADEDAAAEVVVGEPSTAEIRTAYRARVATLNNKAVEVLGAADAGAVALTLEDAQKLSCNSLDRPDIQYDCRVEVRLRIADGVPTTRLVNLWLIHEGDGWVVR
jgi:hypothetical protein